MDGCFKIDFSGLLGGGGGGSSFSTEAGGGTERLAEGVGLGAGKGDGVCGFFAGKLFSLTNLIPGNKNNTRLSFLVSFGLVVTRT